MPTMASIVGNDPLTRFLRGLTEDGEKRPIPLIATRIDVTIRGGLAIVTTERTFRNAEKTSIEATMTFPVPVDATLCALTARIDGGTLNGVAQARGKARETYEGAIDKGKTAVLHEELLKGIHMLSVAQVGPGTEIVVTGTWTVPLSFAGSSPYLRIPTTVGQIYGSSPFGRSDDLVVGDTVHEATLGIVCEDGRASLLRAGTHLDGRIKVTLDAPIDIMLAGWRQRTLEGVAADGRHVTLEIAPAPKADQILDIDLLFDHSGSMGMRALGEDEVAASKLTMAKTGLAMALRNQVKSADRIRLWEFDDKVEFVGEATGAEIGALVARLSDANGGTEIGRAFDAVIANGKAKTVVIVTDGKSYAFAPHTIARTGIRVFAVLIGEDALEAGIAHLAGMTGGQVFIATGSDAGAVIKAALDAARAPYMPSEQFGDVPSHIETLRRGARVVAAWGKKTAGQSTDGARQVGATAAMLAIPLMREDAAAKLAEAEGIVCHLTSLVLVDEAGRQQAGLPAPRKVALTAPRTDLMPSASLGRMLCCLSDVDDSRARAGFSHSRSRSASVEARGRRIAGGEARLAPPLGASIPPASAMRPARIPDIGLRHLLGRIDWDADPDALRHGDLAGLPPDAIAAIEHAAQRREIVDFAFALGVAPVVAVIGLLAKAARGSSRSAGRLARTILKNVSEGDLAAAMTQVGL